MSGGTLVINGYDTNNNLAISYNATTNQIVLQDDVFGGSAVQQFPRGPVTGIVFNGKSGTPRPPTASATTSTPIA